MLDISGLVALLLSEEMSKNSFVMRNMVLTWFDLLCYIPNLNVLNRVPDLLPKIITYFADSDEEIRIKAQNQLGELLSEFTVLGEARGAPMDERMLQTLVDYSKREEFRDSVHCRKVAVDWIKHFLSFLLEDVKREPGVSCSIIHNKSRYVEFNIPRSSKVFT